MEGPIASGDEAFRLAFEVAAVSVSDGIRRYAEHQGTAANYHETLSRAWVRIVALAIAETPGAGAFDELLSLRPHLLDKKLPLKHYLPATLWSTIARERWVELDLQSFPAWDTAPFASQYV